MKVGVRLRQQAGAAVALAIEPRAHVSYRDHGRAVEFFSKQWDVLPPEYRTTDVCTAIARELSWTRSQLEA